MTELVAPGVVNTMPEKTLEATFDHGEITGDTITGNYDDAEQVLDGLDELGISYDEVVAGARVRGRRQVRRSPGTSCSDTVQHSLDEATA